MPAHKVIQGACPRWRMGGGPDPSLAAEAIHDHRHPDKGWPPGRVKLGRARGDAHRHLQGASGDDRPAAGHDDRGWSPPTAPSRRKPLQRALRQAMERSFQQPHRRQRHVDQRRGVSRSPTGRAGKPDHHGGTARRSTPSPPRWSRSAWSWPRRSPPTARGRHQAPGGSTCAGAPGGRGWRRTLARSIAGSSLVKARHLRRRPELGAASWPTVGRARAGSQGFPGVNPYTASVENPGACASTTAPPSPHDTSMLKARDARAHRCAWWWRSGGGEGVRHRVGLRPSPTTT